MGRKNKTSKKLSVVPESIMKTAVLEVVNENSSIRKVAVKYDIVHVTLYRYVVKYRACNDEKKDQFVFRPHYDVNRVFDKEMEDELQCYLIKASKILYGLTLQQAMKFVYEYAKANNLKYPSSWDASRSCGEEWMRHFRKTHPRLSIRKPEATSLARATAFNETTVAEFFTNLEWAYEKLKQLTGEVRPNSVYNLDETGLTNVQTTRQILAEKGQKQVSQATSAERGLLVTACCFINALGQSLPPFMVFPRVFFKSHFLIGAPTGTDGCGTKNASGWMNGEAFMKAMEHFRKFSNCSKSNPVVLILDNHESHITMESLEFYKANGIIAVTLPPHTSQKLQPLDRCVFGPLKTAYNIAINDYMITNPSKLVTMFDIASLLGKAYDVAFSSKNIKSSFLNTGIYPLNKNIFSAADFNFAYCTDREPPQNDECTNTRVNESSIQQQSTQQSSNSLPNNECVANVQPTTPSVTTNQFIEQPNVTSNTPMQNNVAFPSSSGSGSSRTTRVSPEEVRPFKKASPRKKTKRTRDRIKSTVLTRTPVKDQLIEKLKIRKEKKELKDKKAKLKMKNMKNVKPKENIELDSSDDEISSRKRLKFIPKGRRPSKHEWKPAKKINLHSDDESSLDISFLSDSSNPEEFSEDNENLDDVKEGSWVLVKYVTEHENKQKHFIGQVKKVSENDITIKSVRKRGDYFLWPEKDDIEEYKMHDIVSVLPSPFINRRNKIKFFVNFSNLQIY